MQLTPLYMVLFLANLYRICQSFSKGNRGSESVCNSTSSCSCRYQNVCVTFFRYRGKYLMRRTQRTMMLTLLYMMLFLANQYHTCLSFSKGNCSCESVCNCGYQNVSVTFLRYREKYLMSRISYPSNGSFNPY